VNRSRFLLAICSTTCCNYLFNFLISSWKVIFSLYTVFTCICRGSDLLPISFDFAIVSSHMPMFSFNLILSCIFSFFNFSFLSLASFSYFLSLLKLGFLSLEQDFISIIYLGSLWDFDLANFWTGTSYVSSSKGACCIVSSLVNGLLGLVDSATGGIKANFFPFQLSWFTRRWFHGWRLWYRRNIFSRRLCMTFNYINSWLWWIFLLNYLPFFAWFSVHNPPS